MNTSGFLTITSVRADGTIDSVDVRTRGSFVGTICTTHANAILVTSVGLNETGHETFYFHRISPTLDVIALEYELGSFIGTGSPADIIPLGEEKYLIPLSATVTPSEGASGFYFLTVDLAAAQIRSKTIPLAHPDLLKSAVIVFTADENLTQIVLLNLANQQFVRYNVADNQVETLSNFLGCPTEPRVDQGYFIFDRYFLETEMNGKVVDPFSFETLFDISQHPELTGDSPKITPFADGWGVLTPRQAFLYDMNGELLMVNDLPENAFEKDTVLLQPLAPAEY